MRDQQTNNDEALALSALGWALTDDMRAARFLALTGLTPDALRGGLGKRSTLAAVLRFLEAHEPDLIACAAAIGADPADLPETRRRLEG
ncbi:MAG: DUF3572 family protein [Sphingomonas sp.]|nr:DUF3572 family protein [Sphingomonas sp.]